MIYGLNEKVITMRIKIEKEETKCIKEILLKQLNDDYKVQRKNRHQQS